MSRDELLRVLQECADDPDGANGHRRADEALLAFIDDGEIDRAYHAIVRWYE